MSDLIDITKKVESRIKLLGEARLKIIELAREKALKHAEYEKALAVTVLKIKNGVLTEFEGGTIEGLAR